MLKELLEKQFITLEELETIEQHEDVVVVENLGNSGKHNGYTWFNVVLNNNEEYSVYV